MAIGGDREALIRILDEAVLNDREVLVPTKSHSLAPYLFRWVMDIMDDPDFHDHRDELDRYKQESGLITFVGGGFIQFLAVENDKRCIGHEYTALCEHFGTASGLMYSRLRNRHVMTELDFRPLDYDATEPCEDLVVVQPIIYIS